MDGAMPMASGSKMPANGWRKRQIMQWIPEEHMNEKTFAAIEKLKEVERELHRLKNALEMANKASDAKREWVGLTEDEIRSEIKYFCHSWYSEKPETLRLLVRALEAKLREKNNG
jgi:hypothetical protein